MNSPSKYNNHNIKFIIQLFTLPSINIINKKNNKFNKNIIHNTPNYRYQDNINNYKHTIYVSSYQNRITQMITQVYIQFYLTNHLSRKYKESNKGGYGPNNPLSDQIKEGIIQERDSDIDNLFENTNDDFAYELIEDQSSNASDDSFIIIEEKENNGDNASDYELVEKQSWEGMRQAAQLQSNGISPSLGSGPIPIPISSPLLSSSDCSDESNTIYTNNSDLDSTHLREHSDNPALGYQDTDTEVKLRELHIGTLNVRGITEIFKQQTILDYANTHDFDILGLTETRHSNTNTFHIMRNNLNKNNTKQYSFYWTGGTTQKIHGVGVMIEKELSKHIMATDSYNNHGIRIDFSFKRRMQLRVLIIYNPPTGNRPQNRIIQNELNQWVNQSIQQYNTRDTNRLIIMGDFNGVPNPHKDRFPSRKTKNPETQLIRQLRRGNYIDTFREVQEILTTNDTHMDTKHFTWSNTLAKSRIDQIWISTKTMNLLKIAKILPTKNEIDTDHMCPTIILEDSFRSAPTDLRYTMNREYKYKVKNLDKETWDKFTDKLSHTPIKAKYARDIEGKWNQLKNNVIQGANLTFQKIKRTNTRAASHKSYLNNHIPIYLQMAKLRKIYKEVRELGRNKGRNSQNQQTNTTSLINITKTNITKYNKENQHDQIEIDVNKLLIDNTYLHTCKNTLTSKLKLMKLLGQDAINKYCRQHIKASIENRQTLFITNKTQLLNKVLDRYKPQIITNTIIDPGETNKTLLTDPVSIKENMKQIYENWATNAPTHDIENFSEWKKEYSPKTSIRTDIYASILQPFSTDEISQIIVHMTNDKAPGSSKIPYELWKHLDNNHLQELTDIFNGIIETGIIPRDWKHNIIIPITKPKPWEKDLRMTRPIALLETARKIFTKGIYNRIAPILTKQEVLSDSNWAGLPGGSTAGPIHIINNCMEDAREKQKPLWILTQDIAKAFDSVNDQLLIKAMQRIKFPRKLQKIISELYLHTTAQAISHYGLTEEFTRKCGIPQGDALSPLLWRIYYDPLLTRLTSSPEGYQLSADHYDNITIDKPILRVKQKVNVLTYMDDTTYIASTKEELMGLLQLTQQFSQFTGMRINFSKSELMTINVGKAKDPRQTIVIEGQNIQAIYDKQSIRFLGVHLQPKGKAVQKLLITNKVKDTCNILKRKKLTDKETRYIINHVIYPQIEYLLQDIIINDDLKNTINSHCLTALKYKAGYAITAINSLFTSRIGYHTYDIYQRHAQQHINTLNDRLNEQSIMGSTTRIRLQAAQNGIWIDEPILKQTKINNLYKKLGNLTAGIIELAAQYHIEWTIPPTYSRITTRPSGGKLHISTLWSNMNEYLPVARQLRQRKIAFLEQILDFNYNLIQWKALRRLIKGGKGVIPKWYKFIQNKLNFDNTHIQQAKDLSNMDHNLYSLENKETRLTTKKWLLVAVDETTNILGKVTRMNTHGNHTEDLSTAKDGYLIHHTQEENNNVQTDTLIACPGCRWKEHHNKRYKCLVKLVTIKDLPKINIAVARDTKSQVGHRITERLERIQDPLNTLNARVHWKPQEMTSIPGSIYNELNKTLNTKSNIIDKVLKTYSPQCIKDLKEIQYLIKYDTKFEFYTDGSLNNSFIMGQMKAGWMMTKPKTNPNLQFISNVTEYPTSTKAELMAILLTLIVVPKKAEVTIYSDSQAAINMIETVKNTTNNRVWKQFNHNITLLTIKQMVREQQLKVKLIKVKAHSNDICNNIIDASVRINSKTWLHHETIHLKPDFIKGTIFIPAFKNKIIEVPIKRFIKGINNSTNMLRWSSQNRTQETLGSQKMIDTNWSYSAIATHPSAMFTHPNSFEDTRARSFRLKIQNEELPTITKLHLRNPQIYRTNTCPGCNADKETNIHVFTCSALPEKLTARQYRNEMVEELTNLIHKHNKKLDRNLIYNQIDNEDSLQYHNPYMITGSQDLSFIDIIRGYAPKALIQIIQDLIHSGTETKKIWKTIQSDLTEKLQKTWYHRIEQTLLWEKQNNITSQKKNLKSNNKIKGHSVACTKKTKNKKNSRANTPSEQHKTNLNNATLLQTYLNTHGSIYISNFFYTNFN